MSESASRLRPPAPFHSAGSGLAALHRCSRHRLSLSARRRLAGKSARVVKADSAVVPNNTRSLPVRTTSVFHGADLDERAQSLPDFVVTLGLARVQLLEAIAHLLATKHRSSEHAVGLQGAASSRSRGMSGESITPRKAAGSGQLTSWIVIRWTNHLVAVTSRSPPFSQSTATR